MENIQFPLHIEFALNSIVLPPLFPHCFSITLIYSNHISNKAKLSHYARFTGPRSRFFLLALLAQAAGATPGGRRDVVQWAAAGVNGTEEAWVFGGAGVGLAEDNPTRVLDLDDVYRLEVSDENVMWTWYGVGGPAARRLAGVWGENSTGDALLFGGGSMADGRLQNQLDLWHFTPNCAVDGRIPNSPTVCVGPTDTLCALQCVQGYLTAGQGNMRTCLVNGSYRGARCEPGHTFPPINAVTLVSLVGKVVHRFTG